MSLAKAITTGDLAELPSRRDEDWRWTDLRGLVRTIPPRSTTYVGNLAPGVFDALAEETIRIVNGELRTGITIASGGEHVVAARFIAAPGATAHAAAPSLTVEKGRLTLLETYEGDGDYLSEIDLTLNVEAGGHVERIVLADEGADAVSVARCQVALAPGASFAQTVITVGARRQRIETHVVHGGGGAMARLDGVYVLDAKRHADITTVVTHGAAGGTTNQLIKGRVDGQARGVFQGRIVVSPGADQTDARMGHHALVLSDKAEVDAKPELEIYADDVACAHGNTVGALDEEALFYAQARGIPEADARAMLTEAFLGEVIDRIGHEGARDVVRAWVADRLAGGGVMTFNVEAARAEFPILSRQINGKPLVYLDSAASAQKPLAVIEAMTAAMSGSYSNVHRGIHTLANETTEAYEKARQSAARLINAGSASQIVFTKGATEAINLVASSLGQSLEAGDEIVLSQMEHHANIVPWHFLRERKGLVLRFIPVTEDGRLDLAAYRAMLGPRTKVVAVSHMSNVLGTINPVAEIVRDAHAAGALVLLDGAQATVHTRVDVRAIDADFYAFSGHKLYGPTGIGVLYGRAEALAALPPYQGGGEMIGTVTEEAITYADPPHRFEAGTPPILEAIGLGAAIDWLETLDRDAIAAHEHALYERVKAGLVGANWLTEIGTAPGKGALFAFTVEGAHAHDVAQILDRYGVAVRAGTHCAEPLMRRFGLTSSARASFALYNTLEEADSFVDALIKTRTFFS